MSTEGANIRSLERIEKAFQLDFIKTNHNKVCIIVSRPMSILDLDQILNIQHAIVHLNIMDSRDNEVVLPSLKRIAGVIATSYERVPKAPPRANKASTIDNFSHATSAPPWEMGFEYSTNYGNVTEEENERDDSMDDETKAKIVQQNLLEFDNPPPIPDLPMS